MSIPAFVALQMACYPRPRCFLESLEEAPIRGSFGLDVHLARAMLLVLQLGVLRLGAW